MDTEEQNQNKVVVQEVSELRNKPEQQENSQLKQPRRFSLTTPVAIILAGLFIGIFTAGAILYTSHIHEKNIALANSQPTSHTATDTPVEIPDVTSTDHILGNPNAPIKIVEYSDTECPFCKEFHASLKQAVADNPGEVAWVYRYFPLLIHPKSPNEALSVECASSQGSTPDERNTIFWNYIDKVFEITPSNDQLDPAELPKIASDLKLDVAAFNSCVASKKYANVIADQTSQALAGGAEGTPWTVVIAPNGKKFAFSGAQPYDLLTQVIDAAKQQK